MKNRKFYTTVLIMVYLSILFFPMLPVKVHADAENWLEGFEYRKRHDISGSAVGNQTSYQMVFYVHYGSGADSGREVYLDSTCQVDFDDVRFTSDDGETQCDYWLEKKTNSNHGFFHVEVPSIPTTGTSIYLYWGNSTVSTASSGANTFVFYDNFDTDTTASYTKYGTVTYDGVNKKVDLGTNTGGANGQMYMGTYNNASFNARLSASQNSLGNSLWCLLFRASGNWISGGTAYSTDALDGTSTKRMRWLGKKVAGAWTEISASAIEPEILQYSRVRADAYGINFSIKVWVDDRIEPVAYNLTDLTDSSISSGAIGSTSWDAKCQVDFFFVSKFVDPEPTHSTWGSTEAGLFYITYYFSDFGSIKVNSVSVANGTELYHYKYADVVLDALPESNYTFVNHFNSSYYTGNPFSFSVLYNDTWWTYFGEPPPLVTYVVARFTFSPSNVSVGDTVSFNGTMSVSSAEITTYNWTFGDAGTSNISAPTHVYSAVGNYSVVLTVTSNDGTGNFTQYVCVYEEAGDTYVTTVLESVPSGGSYWNQTTSFVTDSGVLYENFENLTQWTVGGTGASQEADIDYFRNGTQGLKLNAVNGNAAYSTKTISTSFSSTTNFIFWLYVFNRTQISTVNIYLSSSATFAKYFSRTVAVAGLRNGWNRVNILKTDFSNTGSDSWSNTMVRFRVRVSPATGESPTVTFDDFRYDQEGMATIIISFDDTWDSQITAMNIMSANDQSGVSFVVTDHVGTASHLNISQLDSLKAAGWDISNHGKNHTVLTSLSSEMLLAQVNEAYHWLVDNDFNFSAKFFAYPNGIGSYNDTVISVVREHHVLARSVLEATYEGYMELKDAGQYSLKCMAVTNTTTVQSVKDRIDRAISQNSYLILLFHKIENVTADAETEYLLTNFQNISDYLKTKQDAGSLQVVTLTEYYESYAPDAVNTTTVTIVEVEEGFPVGILAGFGFMFVFAPMMAIVMKRKQESDEEDAEFVFLGDE